MALVNTGQTYELVTKAELASPSKQDTGDIDKMPLLLRADGGTDFARDASCPCCSCCRTCCSCFGVTMRMVCCVLLCIILFPFIIIAVNVNWWIWNRSNVSGGACPIKYDPTQLEPITQAARAAFCQFDQAEKMVNWDCDPCKKSGLDIVPGTYRPIDGDFISPNSTHAYAVKLSERQGPAFSRFRRNNAYKGACLIAFRGSLNFYNTIANIDFPPSIMPSEYNCPHCLVHDGFFRAWQNMEEKTVATLNEIGCKNRPLIITGHSLGAAMGTFATWALTQVHGFELKMFYSFESPRVGDPAFHYYFNKNIVANKPAFRFTYYNDAVVHLPPADTGFQHVNCEVYYDEKGSFKICNDEEDPTCSASWNLLPYNFDLGGEINGTGAHCHPSYESTGSICWC